MWNKEKLKVYLNNNRFLYRTSRYMYTVLFHRERLQKRYSYGIRNEGKTIFLIRPNAEDGIQGLMSLFAQTIGWIEYAKKKGYVPFVDFKKYKTQYYNGIDNVWEYYFTQPSKLHYDEVYESQRVIQSGPTLFDDVDYQLFDKKLFTDRDLCLKCNHAIWDNIEISAAVNEIVKQEATWLDIENCIGIFIRGTDYIKLKPTGECVQPEIDVFIEKVDSFVRKYPNKKIFLVTEDYNHYTELKRHFEKRLQITSFDHFVKNYDGKDFLSKSNVLNEDKRARGIEYLAKVILLSKCKYFISSIATGSIVAYAMNGKKYEDEYVFDLGLYP